MKTKRTATFKMTNFDRKTGEITIVIDAKDSMFIEETSFGTPQLINSACLTDGLNEILKHGHIATNALTNPGDYRAYTSEINRLNSLLMSITRFEQGERVTIDGLTYQKAINENSFYKGIESQLEQNDCK